MKYQILAIIIYILSAFSLVNLHAKEILIGGQLSGWLTFNKNSFNETQTGLRYIPELGGSQVLAEEKKLDAEIAFNLYSAGPVNSPDDFKDNTDLKLYRFWLRYSSPQFETRIGLQKINFGPAKILRSLMWFDRLDIRDPLQLTDGVYAILMRYYFLNNSNIWVWGLYGNEGLKGLEVFKTEKGNPEFGGRFQMPVPKGEMAVSLNRRNIDASDWKRKILTSMSNGIENRYGLDGNWDIGPGLWFEAVLGEIKVKGDESLWQKFLTIGADYTFDIGPGIHLLYEHFIKSSGMEINKQTNISNFSTLLLDFNISLLDSVNGIGYYDWKQDKIYTFFGMQRTYDNWLINLIIFSSRKDEQSMYAGTGIQCLFTYNY